MNKLAFAGAAAIAVAAAAYFLGPRSAPETAEQMPAPGDPIVSVAMPENLSTEATMGERAFDAVCATCHGDNAAGKMGSGPPLVHEIYEPSHHGDMAFQMAVQRGVQAHHWRFGNMPPQEGLTQADVSMIVAYVRELQRANGIN
ncbi:c-type cytochrome [Histidinibacterium aquaticum]|uniref:Cytochrome c n=1 Tax=Histidinibacterium aquaticum TaxID=2613962 RepID=A0A5J5GKK3_9RHOB|nr:cytochrome c [Histidinibacterium aquaticum]KAA9008851.1 cytochrome c [Histidinibacterium aquaticum]